MDKIVVTRHRALVEYLKELGFIDDDTRIIPHAQPEDVEGKHVIGVLPYWLAAHAKKYTELQLRLPFDKRNKELTLEEIKFHSKEPVTYIVKEVPFYE